MTGFTRIAALAVGISALSLTGAASAATLIGATMVRVTSAVPDWLQIGEIVATSTGNVNVALGGTTATSAHVGTYGLGAAVAVDGIFPVDYPNIWHSDTSGGTEFFDVTFLGGAADLKGLTLYGRAPCCETYNVPERDIYNVTVFNAQGDTLWTGVLDASRSETAMAAVAFVPEPASWALMIAGFGLVGAAMRRRALVAA